MASKKKLRKQLRMKEKKTISPEKKEEIVEEIDLLGYDIEVQNIKRMAQKRPKRFKKKPLHDEYKKTLSPLNHDQAEFDEFGLIIFRLNKNDIFISLPDPELNQSFVIEKQENERFDELIIDTVSKAAVNAVRFKKQQRKKKQGIKNLSKTTLNKAISSTNYDDRHDVVGIQNLDQAPLDLELPVYSFVSLNLNHIYQQADKSNAPMHYKDGVFKIDIDDDKEIFFKREVQTLIEKIQKNHKKSLLDPKVA